MGRVRSLRVYPLLPAALQPTGNASPSRPPKFFDSSQVESERREKDLLFMSCAFGAKGDVSTKALFTPPSTVSPVVLLPNSLLIHYPPPFFRSFFCR